MDSLLIFLLDASSSMAGSYWGAPGTTIPPEVAAIRDAGRGRSYSPVTSPMAYGTVKAYNHFLQVMQYREDDCHFIHAEFSQHCYIKYNGPLIGMQPLTLNWVADGGHTNLWSSIKVLLTNVDDIINRLPVDERPTNVTFVYQTDGQDKGMTDGARDMIQERITLRGWDVLFLGAGKEEAGYQMGLKAKQILKYDPENPGDAFDEAANLIIEHLVTGDV